jgi:tRNA (guanosine-2'-O-)-methyltransferase
MSQRLYDILAQHLTERKRQLFDIVVTQRTRHITIVLEDIFQAQNVSAILRSAESWGVQDLHVVENNHSYTHHRRIARGSNDWLTVHRYNKTTNNSAQCLEHLRNEGYQILTTALHHEAIPLHQVDLSKKTAIVMGTELTGASQEALDLCDHKLLIPMFGFTESLNVSVAAAVIMQNLTARLRSENIPWGLSDAEKLALKLQWAQKTIYWSQHIIEMFETGEIK